MDEETRNSLVELISNHPEFEVQHIAGANYRVYPTSYEGKLPCLTKDHGIAVFGHTFVPNYKPHFRYYLKPIWEDEEFSQQGHKRLREVVKQFKAFSGVTGGTLQ